MARIDRPYDTSYWWCVITMCPSRAISLITTFTVYVTACRVTNLQKSVILGKQLRLKTTDTHSVVNSVIFVDE